MSLQRRPAPLIDLVSVRDALDRLFDDDLLRPLWTTNGARAISPALDVYTTAEALVVKAALPGVKPEDVEITIADDIVTISGTFKEEQERTEAGYTHKELNRGAFRRSFTVPAALKTEDAKAAFKDGLLTLTIPRAEEVKPRHVKVEVA